MLSNTTRTRQLTVDSWKLVSTITWKHNKKLWVSFLKRPQCSQSVLILLSGIPPHYILFFGKDPPPSHCFPWHGLFVWNCKMRSVYPISLKLGHVVCSYMWYIFISCIIIWVTVFFLSAWRRLTMVDFSFRLFSAMVVVKMIKCGKCAKVI